MNATGLLWIAATVWYLLCEAITASVFPGYDYATFYISDLGVAEHAELQGRVLESQIPQVMNAGFIGAGLLFFVGLALLVPQLSASRLRVPMLVLGALYTAGITFVGLVPGSPSNVDNGLIVFHAAGAVAAIAAGNALSIVSVGPLRFLGAARRIGPVLGAIGFASAALLVAHVALPDGVWERGAVYTFMLWQLVVGALLLRGSKTPAERSPERRE
ncbi:DUF998 domain-containing protein [Microbacterium marinilacus]|uniref:DUF998 domain-containing protein n=1 Tax=Microbacterium marinilacus TaxID=415209 RepID=A0ABP7BYI1_9MICO|nr:DUF998 domain-containing protein [Microbacterium marinilacus]MBY0688062.1 DUF998 domain-containing protein [Microbacterium marinilacus]